VELKRCVHVAELQEKKEYEGVCATSWQS
jgi:hypothetical protein